MNDKIRSDIALVQMGMCESREKAQAAIMAGQVYIGEKKILKPSEMIIPGSDLTIRNPAIPYVSRGALKLEKAVHVFHADLHDRIIMDIGASTGGFTDVCLKNGAKKVYAVDVGYGQLDWKLRNDPRVCVMERTNARFLTADQFDPLPQITVMDVSFISIQLILPVVASIMGPDGVFYTLIKPQFEAGRENIGKKGVVRDPEIHKQVLLSINDFCDSIGWSMNALDYSPITGPEGNIEFLARIIHGNRASAFGKLDERSISDVVFSAHSSLDQHK